MLATTAVAEDAMPASNVLSEAANDFARGNMRSVAEKLSSLAGPSNPEAAYVLGMAYRFQGDTDDVISPADALKWLTLASDHGHAGAEFEIGHLLWLSSTAEVEKQRGWSLLLSAAEKAVPRAELVVAANMLKSTGASTPLIEKYAEHAWLKGLDPGVAVLGDALLHPGPRQNIKRGIGYLNEAVARGDALGEYYLGSYTSRGIGVAPDMQRVGALLILSAAQSGNAASEIKDKFLSTAAPDEKRGARELAERLKSRALQNPDSMWARAVKWCVEKAQSSDQCITGAAKSHLHCLRPPTPIFEFSRKFQVSVWEETDAYSQCRHRILIKNE